MIRWIVILAGVIAAMLWFGLNEKGEVEPVGQADELTVPSGQSVTYVETVQTAAGPEGLTARFRFLAPDIARGGGTVGVEAAQEDMAHLCETFAIPRLPQTGPVPSQIIISLSDRTVPFGEADPEATQFFEAYSIDGDTCIWEAF